jgi:hypothetical protein
MNASHIIMGSVKIPLLLCLMIQGMGYYFIHTGNTTKLDFIFRTIQLVTGSRMAYGVNER